MYKYCITNGRNINTSDEYYTSPEVYDTMLKYAVERYNLKGKHIVRPFVPSGNYQQYVYDKNDVVIDNPPFSMTTKITNWYINHDIPFLKRGKETRSFKDVMNCPPFLRPTGVYGKRELWYNRWYERYKQTYIWPNIGLQP